MHWKLFDGGTDYFLKATEEPDVVVAQVGDPYGDHGCWERPEDMDSPRTSYSVNKQNPGSEVSAEIAAALAASSLAFKNSDPHYSALLLSRAAQAILHSFGFPFLFFSFF